MTRINDGGHGSYLNYLRDGCRCAVCTEAWRVHCAEQRAARRAKRLNRSDPRHGKPTTYTNWGCRCQRCTKAHRDAKDSATKNTRTAAANWKG